MYTEQRLTNSEKNYIFIFVLIYNFIRIFVAYYESQCVYDENNLHASDQTHTKSISMRFVGYYIKRCD